MLKTIIIAQMSFLIFEIVGYLFEIRKEEGSEKLTSLLAIAMESIEVVFLVMLLYLI